MTLDQNLVVVMGDRRYRVERPWGEPSEAYPLQLISGIAVDSRGRVYAFQRAEPPVIVYNPDASIHTAWGGGRLADPPWHNDN